MPQRGLQLSALVCMAAFACAGAPVTLDAVDSGYYRANGLHTPSLENYLTGTFTGTEYRSFFVFDLSSVTGTINSAALRLFNPDVSPFLKGYVSPDPAETLNFYDVTTPVSDITGNTAGVAGFDDLGSGVFYGSRIVSAADNGTVVEIMLNGAAVSALNSGAGLFALGGALSSISGPADQHVFGFSMAAFVPDHTREHVLDVTPIPEPATTALTTIGALLFVVGGVRKTVRRREQL
jgi:hypothetical protein